MYTLRAAENGRNPVDSHKSGEVKADREIEKRQADNAEINCENLRYHYLVAGPNRRCRVPPAPAAKIAVEVADITT